MTTEQLVPRPLTRAGTCATCPTQFPQSRAHYLAEWEPSHCPACAKRLEGEIATAQAEERRLRAARQVAEHLETQQEQSRIARIRRYVESLNPPPEYAAASLEGLVCHGTVDDQAKQRGAVQIGLRFLEQWPDVSAQLLILRGVTGSGKTHWAWAVSQALVARSVSARVYPLADMIRDLRAPWRGESGPSEGGRLRVYREVDFLVLDDVSKHAFYGERIHQHLYDVLNHRLWWHRPTVLTTNEGNDGLREILGPALMSRVAGGGGVVEFGSADWRIKQARARG